MPAHNISRCNFYQLSASNILQPLFKCEVLKSCLLWGWLHVIVSLTGRSAISNLQLCAFCRSVHPSIHMSFCLSVCMYVCLSACLSVFPSVYPYVSRYVCLSVCLSICSYFCVSVCYACLSVWTECLGCLSVSRSWLSLLAVYPSAIFFGF